MSIFSPVDVRGPSQRHKALLQRVLAQGQVSHSGALPMPGTARTSALLAAQGRGKRTATGNVTQASNILPSILAKLGIAGRGLPSEVSPGNGLPIDPPRATPSPFGGGGAPPIPTYRPSAVPSPGVAAADVAPTDEAPADPTAGLFAPVSPTADVQLGAGDPTPAQAITGPGALPDATGGSNVFTTVDSTGAATGKPLVDPGSMTTSSAPVPLGNGLWYDPATGTILGQQTTPDAGTVARSLATRISAQ